MTHPRMFRFGVQVNPGDDATAWRNLARKVEDLGYSTIVLEDHFNDTYAPVPAMQAAADATEHLRVATHVFCNDYKHPVVLAKEVATLDVLTEGRVEFGLGAGWMNSDYRGSGIPHDRAGVRIARMREGLAVVRGMWSGEPFSFTGEHYTIDAMTGWPQPVQRPMPVMLGGGGRKVLTFAAQEADIVGIAPAAVTGEVDAESARTATAAATDEKLTWIREAAGPRFDDLELNMILFSIVITDDRDGVGHFLASAFGMTVEEGLSVPHTWVGSIDEICDDLEERRARWGVSYYTVPGESLDAAAPIVARLAGN